MADVEIIPAGPPHLDTVVALHNEIFRPQQDAAFFKRRFLGRYNLTTLLAHLDGRPVGFIIGFELKPSTYYIWLCGVLPDFRGAGVANQLMHAMHGWAGEHQYEYVRLECHNRHREILRLAVDHGYDISGIRWEHERGDNVIIFEKTLPEPTE